VLRGEITADLGWGLLLSVSTLAAALAGPFVGRLADRMGRWKVFAGVATISFLSALVLASVIGNRPWQIIAGFITASAFFYLAANLYDSLLNSLVTGMEKPAFSGFAWGFG